MCTVLGLLWNDPCVFPFILLMCLSLVPCVFFLCVSIFLTLHLWVASQVDQFELLYSPGVFPECVCSSFTAVYLCLMFLELC